MDLEFRFWEAVRSLLFIPKLHALSFGFPDVLSTHETTLFLDLETESDIDGVRRPCKFATQPKHNKNRSPNRNPCVYAININPTVIS